MMPMPFLWNLSSESPFCSKSEHFAPCQISSSPESAASCVLFHCGNISFRDQSVHWQALTMPSCKASADTVHPAGQFQTAMAVIVVLLHQYYK
ncbi:hypothetical protein EE612_053755 [Oryza sativa]|uniref:Uncharacterized protein n=1 Tax=Oryza nivara TaxID=4536 RepID=A0A0E0IYR2_ORYNI|nr:hypothetical protein EE612_053755 [Oryza sativa]